MTALSYSLTTCMIRHDEEFCWDDGPFEKLVTPWNRTRRWSGRWWWRWSRQMRWLPENYLLKFWFLSGLMLLCFCKTVDLCNLAIILPMGWLTTSHHHSAIGGAMARHCGLPFKCYNVGIAPKLVALPWCLRNLAVDSLVGMLLKRRRMSSRRPRDQSGPPGYQGGHWETTWQRRPKHKSTSHQARSNLISFSSIFRTYQLTKLGFSHFFFILALFFTSSSSSPCRTFWCSFCCTFCSTSLLLLLFLRLNNY